MPLYRIAIFQLLTLTPTSPQTSHTKRIFNISLSSLQRHFVYVATNTEEYIVIDVIVKKLNDAS